MGTLLKWRLPRPRLTLPKRPPKVAWEEGLIDEGGRFPRHVMMPRETWMAVAPIEARHPRETGLLHRKREYWWFVARRNGGLEAMLHSSHRPDYWMPDPVLSGEQPTAPAVVAVSSHWIHKQIEAPDYRRLVSGGLSGWQKLEIATLAVLAGCMMFMLIFMVMALYGSR